MADQYSGDMMVGLDRVVEKAVRPYGFPQPGVFTLDIFEHFNPIDWLPFVLLAAVAKTAVNGSKATGIHVEK